MGFAVVQGGRDGRELNYGSQSAHKDVPLVEDVEAEARRRLRACRLDEWRTREFITGRAMPADIRHYALQVDFAAKAISRLSPIPQDFDSDVYWPRLLED